MAGEIILKIEGIDGESSVKGHEGAIDVLAWSWGASHSGGFHPRTGGGMGQVSITDLSLTKYVDLATAALWFHCSRGKHVTDAILTVRRPGAERFEYLVITMTNVSVTSVSIADSESGNPATENITLKFAKVKMKYTTPPVQGTPGSSKTYSWDIVANQGDLTS
jgi:type VI secretion system secreted protein Hcp